MPAKSARLDELRASLEHPELWTDYKKLIECNKSISALDALVGPLTSMSKQMSYLLEIAELDEPDLQGQLESEVAVLESSLSDAMMLASAPDDHKAAYLTIIGGSGGREAFNWADMLLRMYAKRISKLNLEAEFIDFVPNKPDGIKTVTLKVTGERPFGKLKAEAGIHRLSRVSPFDQADRRQTSFAAVEIVPEANESKGLVVDPKDLETWTCCGGGPGGQNVNKRETVVNIKHLPTGISVRCQNERTQEANKAIAMELLLAKLEKKMRQEDEAKFAAMKEMAPKAAFGNEYRRTYVLSQNLGIHDHLTGKSTTEVKEVLDGDFDDIV